MTARRFRLFACGVAALAVGTIGSSATALPNGSPPLTAVTVLSIVAVDAVPYPQPSAAVPKRLRNGVILRPTKLNVVTKTSGLIFKVTIRNVSGSDKTRVRITLMISRPTLRTLVKTEKVDAIGQNQVKTVTFRNIGRVPYADKTTVRVSVENGGQGTYPVIFSLP